MSLTSVVVGLLLLGASIYWSSSDAPPITFSDEEARAYLHEGGKLHDMAFKTRPVGRAKEAEVSAEQLAEQQRKFDDEKASLASTRNNTSRLTWIMFGSGLALTVGGLFAHKLTSA